MKYLTKKAQRMCQVGNTIYTVVHVGNGSTYKIDEGLVTQGPYWKERHLSQDGGFWVIGLGDSKDWESLEDIGVLKNITKNKTFSTRQEAEDYKNHLLYLDSISLSDYSISSIGTVKIYTVGDVSELTFTSNKG